MKGISPNTSWTQHPREKLLVTVAYASRWKTSTAITKKQNNHYIKTESQGQLLGKFSPPIKRKHGKEYPLLPCAAVLLGMAVGTATAILKLWGELRLCPVESQEERWKRPETLVWALIVWSGQPWSHPSSRPLFMWDNKSSLFLKPLKMSIVTCRQVHSNNIQRWITFKQRKKREKRVLEFLKNHWGNT